MTTARRHIDLRDPQVDLRDVIVDHRAIPKLDAVGLQLVEELAMTLGDPQVDLLLARARANHRFGR